ncbi:MAG: ferredoxin-thioredoxin reductase catalytic domain-containing protein [Saccharofermentanales bacterium]
MDKMKVVHLPSEDEKERLYQDLLDNALKSGYFLNPDKQFDMVLMNGLLVNEYRYGYQSCPCRLATGKLEQDQDIICPCDYRDPDLSEYGMCYCALYVSEEIAKGEKEAGSIPERRNSVKKDNAEEISDEKYPVWRCKVCGYLCARENPPDFCPICKAKKERFELFKL